MPKTHVDRSVEINADPEAVFQTVVDYSRWTKWSPWLCAEPHAKVTVTDDATSVGSIYAWDGEIVGAGEIEHKRLEPGKLIEDEIRFVRPFKSQAVVKFQMQSAGAGTRLTWSMDGSLPFFLFWMKSQMETFIGMDYERGLRMVKEYIETGTVLSKTDIRGVESVGPVHMAGVRQTTPMKDIGPAMETALEQARQKLAAEGLPTDGQPISVYHKFDTKAVTFDYTSGFVLPEGQSPSGGGLSSWSLPRCEGLCVSHTGSYGHLGNGWSAANQYARYMKLKQSKAGCYEIYKNTPDNTPPAELETEIVLPLK